MRPRGPAALLAALLIAMVPALVPVVVHAHSLAFGELQVVEAPDGAVSATLRLRGASNPRGLAIELGEGCTAQGEPQWQRHGDVPVLHQRFDCGASGLAGASVGLAGPGSSEAQVVVRARMADGRRTEQTIRGDERICLEHPPTTGAVLGRYLGLGVEHILLGLDHLLFVLGLVLLTLGPTRPWRAGAESRRRLLLTITAFTLGHSVTLALTVLDVLRLRPAAVEAVIALSIVLLAVERVRPGAEASLTRRRPWLVAAAFGLLHGCGFAGALREVGLPPDAFGTALVGFNLGVELGQLAFVAVLGVAMIGLAWLARRARLAPVVRRGGPAVAYAMGGLAVSWMLERLTALG